MTSPTVTCYVVVGGDIPGDVSSFCEVVGRHLNDIGGPLDKIDQYDVEPTNEGFVVITFRGTTVHTLSAARRTTMLYLRAQGIQVLENRPDKRAKPEHACTTAAAPAEPVGMSDALLVESVLGIMAEHGATPLGTVAEMVGRPVEAVERLLNNLTRAGLVASGVSSVFTLTEAGTVEAKNGVYNGGRKAVVEALLVQEPLSTYDMAESMGCTLTVAKRSVRLLMNEGIVEIAGERTGLGSKPRRVFRLTDYGRLLGHAYVPSPPGRKKMSWSDPTPRLLAVMSVLVHAESPLTAGSITGTANVPVRTVSDILKAGCETGYVQREELSPQPLTYGYVLTESGRSVTTQVMAERAAEEAPTPVRAYRLCITGEVPEATELLRQLKALEGVTVEPWDAS